MGPNYSDEHSQSNLVILSRIKHFIMRRYFLNAANFSNWDKPTYLKKINVNIDNIVFPSILCIINKANKI